MAKATLNWKSVVKMLFYHFITFTGLWEFFAISRIVTISETDYVSNLLALGGWTTLIFLVAVWMWGCFKTKTFKVIYPVVPSPFFLIGVAFITTLVLPFLTPALSPLSIGAVMGLSIVLAIVPFLYEVFEFCEM